MMCGVSRSDEKPRKKSGAYGKKGPSLGENWDNGHKSVKGQGDPKKDSWDGKTPRKNGAKKRKGGEKKPRQKRTNA